MRTKWLRWAAALMVGMAFAVLGEGLPQGAAPADTEVLFLITEGEAAVPPAPAGKGEVPDAANGPKIEVRTPNEGKELATPFEVDVRFLPGPGGEAVSLDSLQLALLALWEIDLTPRVRPYLKPEEDRLHIPKAQVPSGSHHLRFSISDVKGNLSTRVIQVVVK